MKTSLMVISFTLLAFAACKKTDNKTDENPINNNPNSVFEMAVPPGFTYESEIDFDLQIQVLNSADQPGNKVSVVLSTAANDADGKILQRGLADKQGVFHCILRIPSALKEIVCNTSQLGIPENIIIPVTGNKASIVLGGKNPQKVKTVDANLANVGISLQKNPAKFSRKYLPLGWNSTGVPNNLITPNDVVSNQLVNDIWAALPSRASVPINHPTWLDDNATKRTLLVTQTADVWVTFITEGAGYRNTLFYYKYAKNNPPASAANIDSLYIIYPNASLYNSGGGLYTGNKVYIGQVGPDTVIAYGIAPHGYDINTGTLSNGFGLIYANKSFNLEVNPDLKQHLIILYDAPSNKYIMGFEDLNRSSSGCDHDFNDVMFYTTCNPVNAISSDSIISLPPSADLDGDGVNDVDDEYPNDALRAFNNYYPALNQKATVAFEDLWPYYGDYDLNDVVVDFNYQLVTNAQNAVKDVKANYVLRASGAQIENSFAVEFPTTAANIASITGATLESGQTKAVVKVINNIRTVQSRWNTIPLEPFSDSVNYNVNMVLTNPVSLSTFGLNEYNPFIWGNTDGGSRGLEIHLPGKTPTALANTSIFGTGDDRTNVSQNTYYLSKDNLPWAIVIPERFDYPIEKADVVTAHLKFAQWAQSNGTLYTDWYKNLSAYRNSNKIYVKP
ncbi:MAG: LruC domain-containing protein [Bacteroidia bacterium]|nr:LruC domain-containing protein [Bacteroidia bacterium]MCF8425105.1 LruC domain-containing protein [Bacteroidia bacterium]MCF8446638.1 LruC domain-containing protein [Bacteroidia bacterium]